MAEETNNILQSVEVSSSQPATLNTLKSVQAGHIDNALVNVNAKSRKKINGPIQLPQLTEVTKTAYTTGPTSAKPIVCCIVGNHFIERNAAYDFVMMATLASQEGITLKINEAYRTNERQTQLYNERKNKAVAKEFGVAAEPGYSNHQSGIALDISVGMDKPTYLAGGSTPIFEWLTKHAADFGFDHVEGKSVGEPWHWVHTAKTVVGSAAFEKATGYPVLTADSALAASSISQDGVTRIAYQEAHDKTVGYARSTAQSQSSRQDCLAASSAFCANQSNGIGAVVSQVEAVASSTATLEAEPKAFDADTLKAFSYDFETGTWDDGETV